MALAISLLLSAGAFLASLAIIKGLGKRLGEKIVLN